MVANGVDIKTAQKRLGHPDATITLGIYAHAILEKDREAAEMLGRILCPTVPKSETLVEEIVLRQP